MPRKKSLSFEEALDGLETIVRTMESGDMPLAELMENYRKGVALSEQCLQALDQAEKSMDAVIKDSGKGVQEMELQIEGDSNVEG